MSVRREREPQRHDRRMSDSAALVPPRSVPPTSVFIGRPGPVRERDPFVNQLDNRGASTVAGKTAPHRAEPRAPAGFSARRLVRPQRASYSDNQEAAVRRLARFSGRADDLHAKPQESGNRRDTYWVALTDAAASGARHGPAADQLQRPPLHGRRPVSCQALLTLCGATNHPAPGPAPARTGQRKLRPGTAAGTRNQAGCLLFFHPAPAVFKGPGPGNGFLARGARALTRLEFGYQPIWSSSTAPRLSSLAARGLSEICCYGKSTLLMLH